MNPRQRGSGSPSWTQSTSSSGPIWQCGNRRVSRNGSQRRTTIKTTVPLEEGLDIRRKSGCGLAHKNTLTAVHEQSKEGVLCLSPKRQGGSVAFLQKASLCNVDVTERRGSKISTLAGILTARCWDYHFSIMVGCKFSAQISIAWIAGCATRSKNSENAVS